MKPEKRPGFSYLFNGVGVGRDLDLDYWVEACRTQGRADRQDREGIPDELNIVARSRFNLLTKYLQQHFSLMCTSREISPVS